MIIFSSFKIIYYMNLQYCKCISRLKVCSPFSYFFAILYAASLNDSAVAFALAT